MEPHTSRLAPRAVPWWLKLLVALHLFAITVWCLPRPPDGELEGKTRPVGFDWLLIWNQRYLKTIKPLQGYLMATGFWQYWDMFAPNPMQTDLYCTAEVVFRDGTVKPYRYPRMHDYSTVLKYPMERYRKFYERASSDGNRWLWPTFAQRIAEINAGDPSNPPVEVRLTRHWLKVVPPGRPQPTRYQSIMYLDYQVDMQKLRTDLGWR